VLFIGVLFFSLPFNAFRFTIALVIYCSLNIAHNLLAFAAAGVDRQIALQIFRPLRCFVGALFVLGVFFQPFVLRTHTRE
jgi:hypothetical protein